jgi:hypothetical protein
MPSKQAKKTEFRAKCVTDRLSVTVSPTLTTTPARPYLTLLPLPCISCTLLWCLVSSLYSVFVRVVSFVSQSLPLRRDVSFVLSLPCLSRTPLLVPSLVCACVVKVSTACITTRCTRMHCMYHSCLSLSPRSLPCVCVRRQATLPSVRSRRHTLVLSSFTLRTVRT